MLKRESRDKAREGQSTQRHERDNLINTSINLGLGPVDNDRPQLKTRTPEDSTVDNQP